MSAVFKRLPSPAMVVASIGLVVALGGVSYAAGVLPANSVGAKQRQKRGGDPAEDHPGGSQCAEGPEGRQGRSRTRRHHWCGRPKG